MQMYVLILVLGLAGCLATEESMNLDTPEDWAQMKIDLSEEEEAITRSTSPSFEEIKRELESHAILKHPSVIGLYPRGEEPLHQHKRALQALNVSKSVLSYRPICPEVHDRPLHIFIGHMGTLLLRNLSCPPSRCAVCGNSYGLCRLQHTFITLRALYYNPLGKPPGWAWYWKSIKIPACCQCFHR